jgi:hypothetical protein
MCSFRGHFPNKRTIHVVAEVAAWGELCPQEQFEREMVFAFEKWLDKWEQEWMRQESDVLFDEEDFSYLQ